MTVNTLLEALGAAQIPRVTALNKIDSIENPAVLDITMFPHAVPISALKGEGLDVLREEIARVLAESMIPVCVTLPYNRGDLVELFHRRGHVELEEHRENGTLLMGRVAQGLRNYYMPYLCSVPRQAQTTARQRPSNVPG
jgi:GTP-binding protein HflX